MPEMCELYRLLFTRLRLLGYWTGGKWFRKVAAPDWWEPWMRSKDGLTYEMAFHVAQRLGIDFLSLVREDAPLRLREKDGEYVEI